MAKKQSKKVTSKKSIFKKFNARIKNFLSRRPHRTLQLTKRRDYVRELNIPGYWSFTNYVRSTLWRNRHLFSLLVLVLTVLTGLLVGLASQESYSALTGLLADTGSEVFEGDWSKIEQAGLLLLTIMSGGASNALTDVQQVYAVLVGLMVWLTTVWLLRNILAGRKVVLRDGLYNSGAPIVSTFVVFLVMVVQALPAVLAFIGYSAASTSGLLAGGVEAMLFWFAAGLLVILSIYWITGTAVALVMVTLPGMRPFEAIRTAGDLILGRRVRVLLRLIWMVLIAAAVWIIVSLPIVLLDLWLKQAIPAIEWIPIIPVMLLFLGSASIVWMATYIYLLYRKIVDNDTE
jgi:hypothetical protein